MKASSASDIEDIVDAILDDDDELEFIETMMNGASFMMSSLMLRKGCGITTLTPTTQNEEG